MLSYRCPVAYRPRHARPPLLARLLMAAAAMIAAGPPRPRPRLATA